MLCLLESKAATNGSTLSFILVAMESGDILKTINVMKKILLFLCLCCISVALFAQEEKPDNQVVSSEVSALRTAASLAKYGYANYSATALVEAAKIFSETQTQPMDVEAERSKNESVTEKDSRVSFDPVQLLADAKDFAGKDKVVLAYIKQVEKNLKSGLTRGAVGGPRGQWDRVYGKDVNIYQIKFWANELAEISVSGDGDTDLDLYVYDANGNLIGSDIDYTDECVVRWVPAWTGNFIVKVVNRGALYNDFAIWTN